MQQHFSALQRRFQRLIKRLMRLLRDNRVGLLYACLETLKDLALSYKDGRVSEEFLKQTLAILFRLVKAIMRGRY